MCPIKKIVLRYFEKGHTFMSADCFDKNVEEAMSSMKKLYDFSDFVACVGTHVDAIEMDPTEFRLYKNHLSHGKDTRFPHLSDIAEACFM